MYADQRPRLGLRIKQRGHTITNFVAPKLYYWIPSKSRFGKPPSYLASGDLDHDLTAPGDLPPSASMIRWGLKVTWLDKGTEYEEDLYLKPL